MKKGLVLLLLTFITFSTTVSAKEVYYTNQYGVELTKEEYNFITKFYYNGYQKFITNEMYNYMLENNLFNGQIKTSIIEDAESNKLTRVSHETASKILKLSAVCISECNISIVASWKKNPTIKSYDVIGARFNGISYLGSHFIDLSYGDNIITNASLKTASNGIGASIKLPETSEKIVLAQSFRTTKGGTIYASYQHAKKTSTLAKSQNYSFSSAGFGGVFKFADSIKSYYDAMQGVSLTLN